MGGKSRLAREIHDVILKYEHILLKSNTNDFIEPMCGSLSVTLKFVADKTREKIIVCDNNIDLINFYKHLKKYGPDNVPDYVDEKTYLDVKLNKFVTPFKAYIGTIFSYFANYFNSYRGKYQPIEVTQKEGINARNKLTKLVPMLDYIEIHDANDYSKFYDILQPKNSIIYCDPPYKCKSSNSTINMRNFDSITFWQKMREWSKDNLVFISEIEENVPDDFIIVWTKTLTRNMKGKKVVTECLCIHDSWFVKYKSKTKNNNPELKN